MIQLFRIVSFVLNVLKLYVQYVRRIMWIGHIKFCFSLFLGVLVKCFFAFHARHFVLVAFQIFDSVLRTIRSSFFTVAFSRLFCIQLTGSYNVASDNDGRGVRFRKSVSLFAQFSDSARHSLDKSRRFFSMVRHKIRDICYFPCWVLILGERVAPTSNSS